jgi:UDP-glucose 4-epimerase
MKVVVTGGAGFIGANLCRELTAHPQVTEVIALDDLSTGYKENLDGTRAELVVGSILDRGLLAEVVAGASSVIHLAARPSVPRSLLDPVASHEANATGTLYVLEAARAAEVHVAVASSSSVYGNTDVLPKHEDMPTRPLSPYGVSKLAAECYALAHQSSFGLPTVAFRFFNVYGPLQAAGHAYAAVVPAFIDAALRGEPLTVHGDGLQTRDFTFVGTVTRVLADAAVRRVTSETPINLAFGTRSSLLDLIDLISDAVAMPVERQHIETRRGDVHDSQASSERLMALFPGIVPMALGDGLLETVAWFRSMQR